jgi:hypothetical protein
MKEKDPSALPEIAQSELDDVVVEMIDALKKAGTLYAVGSLKNTLLTPDLKELLMFVGISSKQADNRILFAWTEAIKANEGWPDEKN